MDCNQYSEAFYNKGISCFQNQEFEEAVENFNRAIQIDSLNYHYYYNIGLAYIKLEDYRAAVESFNSAISINPKDADSFQNLGIAHLSLKQYYEAVQAYQKAMEINPDDYESYNNLGIANLYIGRNEEACLNFTKASELNPDDASVIANLAYSYMNAGSLEDTEKAKELYLKAISLNYRDEEAYFNLGNIYLKQNKIKEAEEFFKKALEINRLHRASKEALSNLHKLSKAQKELEATKEPEEDPQIAEARECFKQAQDMFIKREFDSAIKMLRKTLNLDNSHEKAMELFNKTSELMAQLEEEYKKAQIYFDKENYIKCINILQKALNVKPDEQKMTCLLKKAQEKREQKLKAQKKELSSLISTGKYEEVVDNLAQAIKENPQEPENYFSLGEVYIKQKAYTNAIDNLRSTLALDPQHMEAQKTLCELITLINKSDEDYKLFYKLAVVYAEKGDYEKAAEELKKIMAIHHDDKRSKEFFFKIIALMSRSTTEYSNELAHANLDKEVAQCQEMIKQNPKNSDAYYKLGLIYEKKNMFSLAMENLLHSIKLKPESNELKNCLYDLIKKSNI